MRNTSSQHGTSTLVLILALAIVVVTATLVLSLKNPTSDNTGSRTLETVKTNFTHPTETSEGNVVDKKYFPCDMAIYETNMSNEECLEFVEAYPTVKTRLKGLVLIQIVQDNGAFLIRTVPENYEPTYAENGKVAYHVYDSSTDKLHTVFENQHDVTIILAFANVKSQERILIVRGGGAHVGTTYLFDTDYQSIPFSGENLQVEKGTINIQFPNTLEYGAESFSFEEYNPEGVTEPKVRYYFDYNGNLLSTS